MWRKQACSRLVDNDDNCVLNYENITAPGTHSANISRATEMATLSLILVDFDESLDLDSLACCGFDNIDEISL